MTLRCFRTLGITFIEILLAIFIGLFSFFVLITSFSRIIYLQDQQSKIVKSSLDVLISLEMLRKDLEMAGFGLPYIANCSLEAKRDSILPDPASFNVCSGPNSKIEPISFGNNLGPNGSDVLILRGSILNYNDDAALQYGIVNSAAVTIYSHFPFNSSFNYILLDSDFNFIASCNSTCLSSCPNFCFIFGIDSKDYRMPFNRVDYYLKKPNNHPSYCSPSTYELYRSLLSHRNGTRVENRLLECVKDFQVAFGVDTNNDSLIDAWYTYLIPSLDVRKQLKQVRVFLLVQEGGYDHKYQSPTTISLGDNIVGVLSNHTITSSDSHYRWKIYKLVINLINLRALER